ncbi:MAG: NAD-dependent epimerase/dehydratase family protein [Leeuwenhoekiella sp.]
MGKTAIILGITGLVGGVLAEQLFKDNDYEQVISFHRRKSGLQNQKLTEYIVDLFELEKEVERFKADVVFCCIGTTKSKTEDKSTYKSIDYGIPLQAAQLCEINAIPTFMAISAMGADASSSIFYNRVKGEMQRDIMKLTIPNRYFLQPALLSGDRNEKRVGESIANAIFKVINPILLGPLRKYRSIEPSKIATTMRVVAKNGYHKRLIESDEIKYIADENA